MTKITRAQKKDHLPPDFTVWVIIVVLATLWGIGLATKVAGIFIHILFAFALIVLLVLLAKRKKPGLPEKPAPLFLTEFQVPTMWDFPTHFEVKNWSGLILCQVIDRDTTDARLLAWWDSRSSYDDYWATRFKAYLALSDPLFRGAMVRRKSIDERWWSKLKEPAILYSIFISFVALLTNVTQLRSFQTWAFAVPDAELLDPQYKKPLVVDEQAPLTVRANNRTHSDCELLLAIPEVVPPTGLTISENMPIDSSLATGASTDIIYHLTPAKPGQYEIRFSGTQHSGQVPGWVPLPERSIKVQVWDKVDPSPSINYKWLGSDDSATFLVTAHHGHPPTSVVEYHGVIDAADVSFLGVTPGTIKQNTNDGGVAVLIWQAAAKTPDVSQEFEVRVKRRKDGNENYWKQLASTSPAKFKISAYPVEGQ